MQKIFTTVESIVLQWLNKRVSQNIYFLNFSKLFALVSINAL